MAARKDETTSFVLRFTQKIFQSEEGEPHVQWRGNIRHVQSGEEKRFSDFEQAVNFIQGKLADLTLQAMEDKSPEEQKGILAKSFDLWKKMAIGYPKMVLDTIKDPKGQAAQFQSQLNQISDAISQKLELDEWRGSTKSDYKNIMDRLENMTEELSRINRKVDKLSKKSK